VDDTRLDATLTPRTIANADGLMGEIGGRPIW